MSLYSLPSMTFNREVLYPSINNEQYIINKALRHYLKVVKENISKRQTEWNRYKKYTNPYEFIHTPIPNLKRSISKLCPLSRSYYKMIEICYRLDIIDDLPNICKTFHMAEGPGGFIEALSHQRKNKKDQYFGMTLMDDNENIPSWKKSRQFLKENKNVYIERGKDNTGDLINSNNLEYCFNRYKSSMHLITGDGGFDFSINFSEQEKISGKLLLSQVAYAIAMQKQHGSLILKFFDMFTSLSIDLLYLLSCIYENVYIIKPNTSRYANSEKYVVCKGFLLCNKENIQTITKHFQNVLSSKTNYINRIYNFDIPYYFIVKLEEINAILGQQQIENINNTFNIINSSSRSLYRMDNYRKNNISRCIHWCKKHGVPYNNIEPNSNMFVDNSNKT